MGKTIKVKNGKYNRFKIIKKFIKQTTLNNHKGCKVDKIK